MERGADHRKEMLGCLGEMAGRGDDIWALESERAMELEQMSYLL